MMSQMTVSEALEALYASRGVLTPDLVVEAAENSATEIGGVLHSHFEWDDKEAGHLWRLEQARSLIRVQRIRVEKPDNTVVTMRRFLHVDPGEIEATYMPALQAMAPGSETRAIILARARNDAKAWVERYKHLEELSEYVDHLAPLVGQGS